jgi:glycosyltransferase involved in cell wall biosynthesis
MTSRPKVAVLLSTYNGEAFLEAQLDSLLAQEGVSLEVFARDDGSSDGTLAILARHAAHWPALASAMAGANLGPAGSFLALLSAAPDGFDAYAFCDQDDVWLPDKLAFATAALAEAGERPALYCSAVMCVDADLGPLGERRLEGDGSFAQLLFENIAFGATVAMNPAARALIVERPPGAAAAMHDWWCALVVAAFGTVIQDPRAEVLYRQHGANAVGASVHRGGELAGGLGRLIGNPRRFYPIHAQAEAFARLWGADLTPERRQVLDALVASRRSPVSRLAFAAGGEVRRARWIDALAVRALIALNLY